MKVAYIYDKNNKHTFAGKTVAQGFKHAFMDRNDLFKVFDMEKFKKKSGFIEKFRLLHFKPDLIFTSVQDIHFLPLDRLHSTKFALWGQFYLPCDYEPQIHALEKETKDLLQKYSSKHDFLVWSQHDEEINERFFQGYQKELGLKFIQLLHAADKIHHASPISDPDFDFVWIGNIGHRRNRYESFITPIKEQLKNYVEFNEHKRADPEKAASKDWYRRSFFAPNIHTDPQVNKRILINERVFTSTLMGSLQFCDNPLARKYFAEDELIIVNNAEEIMEHYQYFQNDPQKRLGYIEKMQENILQNHTYHNRIESILSQF